jgi:glycosyltransferase involved in cell wall biosynthesis
MTGKVYPKVLVASPTYNGKDYIFQEHWDAIRKLDYPNYDYIYIDNSKGDSYLSLLRRRGAKVVHVPRGQNSRQALCNAQNWAREKVLSEGYDYLMFIESDIIPTPDAISRLISYELPVVGATYYLKDHQQNLEVPCIFFTEYKPEVDANGTRLITLQEVPGFLNTGLRQVHGMGLGCTVFRRDIIERFSFWHDERFDNKHSDVYYYMDLHNNKIPVYVDTNFIVKHYPSDWAFVQDR